MPETGNGFGRKLLSSAWLGEQWLGAVVDAVFAMPTSLSFFLSFSLTKGKHRWFWVRSHATVHFSFSLKTKLKWWGGLKTTGIVVNDGGDIDGTTRPRTEKRREISVWGYSER